MENSGGTTVAGTPKQNETTKLQLVSQMLDLVRGAEKIMPVVLTKKKKHRNRKHKNRGMSKFMRQDTEVNAVREFVILTGKETENDMASKLEALVFSTEAFNQRLANEQVTHAHEGITNFLRQDTEVNDLRKFLIARANANETLEAEMKETLTNSTVAFNERQAIETAKSLARDEAYAKNHAGSTGPMVGVNGPLSEASTLPDDSVSRPDV